MKMLRMVALVAIVGSSYVLFSARCHAQTKAFTQTAGVDNSRMGAYRALAQLSYQAFQKGDSATAAELARVLERTWDQGEWHNTSDGSYCKANRTVCQPIDESMDVFIKPIIGFGKKAPDAAAVEAAYKDFLEKLKQADKVESGEWKRVGGDRERLTTQH